MFRSIFNKLKQELLWIWISKFDSESPFWFPKTVQIEPTTFCNLSCPTCPHSCQTQRGHNLSVTELHEIIDRLQFPYKSVILSGVGEPLVNPYFFSIADFLKTRNINFSFYTNGTLLTPQTTHEILTRSNITALAISCDSANKNTFEILRSGANFDKWEFYVRNFIRIARERFYSQIKITMFTVLSHMNLHEVEQLVSFAADIGFERIHFFDPVPIDQDYSKTGYSLESFSEIKKKRLLKMAKRLGVSIFFSLRRAKIPPNSKIRCYLPWVYIFVRSNGDIHPCYALFESERFPIIGNLLQEKFIDIWNSKHARSFRKASVLGNNDFCRICPYY